MVLVVRIHTHHHPPPLPLKQVETRIVPAAEYLAPGHAARTALTGAEALILMLDANDVRARAAYPAAVVTPHQPLQSHAPLPPPTPPQPFSFEAATPWAELAASHGPGTLLLVANKVDAATGVVPGAAGGHVGRYGAEYDDDEEEGGGGAAGGGGGAASGGGGGGAAASASAERRVPHADYRVFTAAANAWAMDNGFEFVEAAAASPFVGAQLREKVGVPRVLEALHTTAWSTMRRGGGRPTPAPRPAAPVATAPAPAPAAPAAAAPAAAAPTATAAAAAATDAPAPAASDLFAALTLGGTAAAATTVAAAVAAAAEEALAESGGGGGGGGGAAGGAAGGERLDAKAAAAVVAGEAGEAEGDDSDGDDAAFERAFTGMVDRMRLTRDAARTGTMTDDERRRQAAETAMALMKMLEGMGVGGGSDEEEEEEA